MIHYVKLFGKEWFTFLPVLEELGLSQIFDRPRGFLKPLGFSGLKFGTHPEEFYEFVNLS